MSSIGECVRRLREDKSLSQERLGELIGVRQTTISEIESGRNKPSWRTLEALSNYFGVHISYFLIESTPTETEIETVA